MFVGGVLIWAFRGAPGPAPARGLGLPALLWVVFVYGTLLTAAPFVSAWIQNAVWSGTRLEGVRFESQVRAGRLIGITLTNLLMIVASIGLLIPFAVMRVMKYKIESIQVLDADALSRFVAEGQGAGVDAAGEGAMDLMGLDFGL